MRKPAYFDSSTGKIMNCKKNTLIYFHEEGHKKWFEDGKEQLLDLLSKDIITVSIPVAILYSTKSIPLTIFASLPFIFSIVSETHAWIYGISKWMKKRK